MHEWVLVVMLVLVGTLLTMQLLEAVESKEGMTTTAHPDSDSDDEDDDVAALQARLTADERDEADVLAQVHDLSTRLADLQGQVNGLTQAQQQYAQSLVGDTPPTIVGTS